MENFKSSGTFTKQAHVNIPEGLYEEEHAREGFFGRVSHIYHQNPPVNWTKIEGDLKPRALPSVFENPKLKNNFEKILFNNDVEVYLGSLDQTPKTSPEMQILMSCILSMKGKVDLKPSMGL